MMMSLRDLAGRQPRRLRDVVCLALVVVSRSAASAAEPACVVLWESPGPGLQEWAEPHGLSCENVDGVLRLRIRERDSRLVRRGLSLGTTDRDAFVIRYRASGFTVQRTTGEIFYANGRHAFHDEHYVHVPSLILDGRWHEMLLPVAPHLRGAVSDWAEGGSVTALRLDLVNEFPGTVEIETILVGPGLRAISDQDVDVGSLPHYLFRTQSFQPIAEGRYTRKAVLPRGRYTVWARLIDTAEGQRLLEGLDVEGGVKVGPTLTGGGRHTWCRVGTCPGGRIALTLDRPPSIFLDAVVIVEGDGVPRDRPVVTPKPVRSTIRPITDAQKRILRPYWRGEMLCYPGRLYATDAKTYFRRIVNVPADIEDAWLQLAVDDRCRLFVNGREVVEGVSRSSWMSPAVLDVTRRLRKGERNCIAVEATNVGSAGGMLFDLVLNRQDHSCVRIVSDGQWRCAIEEGKGWTSPDFDDGTWKRPEGHPGPPNAPWVAEIPYSDKTWQTPTEWLRCDCRSLVRGGESQELAFRFRSTRPVGAGEVLHLALVNEATGAEVVRREMVLSAGQCKAEGDGVVAVSGVSVPLSRWYPSMRIRVKAGIYHRRMTTLPIANVSFDYQSPRTAERLESCVRMVDGVPRLFVNGKAMYPMVGNGEGRDKQGTRQAYKRAGFNIEAIWVDPMAAEQWWQGLGQYRFESVDARIIDDLDYNPDVLILPIVWAAPPLWWQEQNPAEISRFNDGTSWSYYKSTASFASEKWRLDAAAALKAFVGHVESSPYASRVLGYWIVGGVSAEWQGWGCHSSHVLNHLMDYSEPALEGFRRFLQTKYPDRAASLAGAAIPPPRERLAAEIGVFRDPARARLAIDYTQYYSDSNVEALLHCTKAAKDAAGRCKIVGAYFGYLLEYSNMSWCIQMGGHNSLRRALDSPDIDFFSAPPSYGVRRLGQTVGWMWPFRSMQTAGKLVWVDDDTRTFLSGMCDYTPAVNLEQTQAMLRRNFGKALCRLCPQGFLQINSGRELDHPAIARDMRIFRRAGEYALAKGVTRRAEIAVVVDEESAKFLAYDGSHHFSGEQDRIIAWNGDTSISARNVNTLTGDLISYQRDRIARIGAPVDWILFSDLPRRAMDYKLYVMLSCFHYDEATLRAAREKLYGRSATVLWCYAPGFVRGETADVQNMEPLTGMHMAMTTSPLSPRTNVIDFTTRFYDASAGSTSFGVDYAFAPQFSVDDAGARVIGVYRDSGAASLAVKHVGTARSVFCGSNKLSVGLLRGLARAAGVHVYLDTRDPFDANESFLMLHATHGGEKHLRLKRRSDVVDVIEGRILASGVDTLAVSMPQESTRVLFVGGADEFLRFMDYDHIAEPSR